MDSFNLQSSSGIPNVPDNNQHVENRLQDALAGSFEPPIYPTLSNNQQAPLSPVTTSQGAPLFNIRPAEQRPQAVQHPNHYIPDLPPQNNHPTVHQPLKPFAQLLRELPQHDYILPAGGPINATMPEIIAILPNWFRNWDIAVRFQNNGINSSTHIAILEEYRHIYITTGIGYVRARDHIAEVYRKTMRQGIFKWTKAAQKAPQGWNKDFMAVNSFTPDVARQLHYTSPAPILFKSLADGLKKLPQGSDAGDLTRALEFAMQNQMVDENGNGVDFMFPDDLQKILDHIGRTFITNNHTDTYALNRFGTLMRQAAAELREREMQANQLQRQQQVRSRFSEDAHGVQPSLPSLPNQMDSENMFGPISNQMMPQDALQEAQMYDPNLGGYGVDRPHRPNELEAAAAVASKPNNEGTGIPAAPYPQSEPSFLPEIPEVCRMLDLEEENSTSQAQEQPHQDEANFTMEDMDAFFAPHQSLHSTPEYPPTQILRNCVEGSNEVNDSAFARAVRFARQPNVISIDLTVADVEFATLI